MNRCVAVLVLILMPLHVVAQEAAAVVAKYLPPKAQHAVIRNGDDATVLGLGTPLYAGDTLRVAAGGSVSIAYADGTAEMLEGPREFTVPEAEPLGAAARIFDRLQVMLGRKYRQGGNLATRGPGDCPADAVELPALAAPALHASTSIKQGHDNLALAWTGGCAPYSLSLAGSGQGLINIANLKRPQTRIDGAALDAGTYVLAIRDAADQRVEFNVIVLPDLPIGPVTIAEDSSELDAVAYAAWLANYEDGKWRWESFQQLRPWIRQGGTLAGTYGDLVMWGDPSLELADAGAR